LEQGTATGTRGRFSKVAQIYDSVRFRENRFHFFAARFSAPGRELIYRPDGNGNTRSGSAFLGPSVKKVTLRQRGCIREDEGG
jgi:hypothetical protein